MNNNKKELDVVITSGINLFCILFIVFNISLIIKDIIIYVVVANMALQIILSIVYYKLYKVYEIEYTSIYYINFISNILTLVLYTYYIINKNILDISFTIYLVYTFSSFYWIVIMVRDNIKKRNYKLISVDDTGIECSICYENITNNASILECKHIYHRECIDKWLVDNSTCPYCRHSLSIV
jgi:hypothetical protein